MTLLRPRAAIYLSVLSRVPTSLTIVCTFDGALPRSRRRGERESQGVSRSCAEWRRLMLEPVRPDTLSTSLSFAWRSVSRLSFAGLGHVRPCHSNSDGGTAKKCILGAIDRRSNPVGYGPLPENGVSLSGVPPSSTRQRNSFYTRPRGRGLRVALAPLSSSSALVRQAKFYVQPQATAMSGRTI